mgnify:CR=1 FL=1
MSERPLASDKPNCELVAFIPARAGSKRLKRKNLMPLGGKPLVRWTLDTALASGCFDYVIVSSDEPEVLQQAREAGALGIERPAELASDDARVVDAVVHGLDSLAKEGIRPEQLMLLQPTSPFRSTEDIKQATVLMAEKDSDAVISMCPAEHPPFWSGTIPSDLGMSDFLEASGLRNPPRQGDGYYRLNGAIYLVKVRRLLESGTFFLDNTHALVMPRERSVDIDTQLDFSFAEFLFSKGLYRSDVHQERS